MSMYIYIYISLHRADMEGTLFTLDRSTFRYTLARSSTAKHRAVYEALGNVSILKVIIFFILLAD